MKLTMSDVLPVIGGESFDIAQEIPIRSDFSEDSPNLSELPETPQKSESLPESSEKNSGPEKTEEIRTEQSDNTPAIAGIDDLLSHIADRPMTPEEHMEALMSHGEDPIVELASVGARFPLIESEIFKDEFSVARSPEDHFYKTIIGRIREPLSSRVSVSLAKMGDGAGGVEAIAAASAKINKAQIIRPAIIRQKTTEPQLIVQRGNNPNIEKQVKSFYKKEKETKPFIKKEKIIKLASSDDLPKRKHLNFHIPAKKRRMGLWISLMIGVAVLVYGLTLKEELLQKSVIAFNDLEKAGESLKRFDFHGASQNFEKSYESFENVSRTMSVFGAGLAGFFADVPGFDGITGGGATKMKSAKDLAEAGRLIAQSGQAVSEALKSLAQTGSILNPVDKDKLKPSRIVSQIKNALLVSDKNFKNAMALISGVDDSLIPEDKREKMSDFKNKIPLMEEYLGNAIEYTEFLQEIIGIDEPKKYLLLFQNNSELRPTGGFPGTYGVVSFAGGGLADFFVDDIYNLDGQLKENIIPPKQLQHITPVWGMRDSAWFIDFPTSAKKVMSFFSAEAGYGVDGVIALNPDVVSKIIKIIGPIEMPEYDLTFNSDNFLAALQEEVEYGDNRTQPKKVVSDFAPKFLEKLYSADADKWMQIFDVMMAGLEENDIIFYMADRELERFVIKEGFGGEVKDPKTGSGQAGDYLTVNFTNIKGSKTDAVTDTAVDVDTVFEDGKAVHKVTISRNHSGGDHDLGFYNRQNPSYVRVLLPADAEFNDISGNDIVNFKPLINYAFQPDFVTDGELKKYESGFYQSNFRGVDRFTESGKQGIGFWMVTDPDSSKKVEFSYSTPLTDDGEYMFYFQKQSGLKISNFRVALPNLEGKITESTDDFNVIGNSYILDKELKDDFYYEVKK